MVIPDSFSIVYGTFIIILIWQMVRSIRNQYSDLQKTGTKVIMASVMLNLCYLLIYLAKNERMASLVFVLYFIFLMISVRSVFWYVAEMAEVPFFNRRVMRFATWLMVGCDALVIVMNFFTGTVFGLESFIWNGVEHYTFSMRPPFLFHLILSYIFTLGMLVICIAKIYSVGSLYKKRYQEMLFVTILVLLAHIYFDYITRTKSVNLSAAVFAVFSFWIYWNCYKSTPNYQAYLDHFLIDKLETGLVMFNYSDTLESYNKRAADWFGIEEDMRGHLTREEFIKNGDIPVDLKKQSQEFKFLCGEDHIDGRYEVLIEDKKINGYFFVFYDITKEETSRIHLEKYSQNRKNFIANMTHELRTPLNAIIGFSGQLLERMPSGEHRDKVGFMDKSGRLILRYLDEMQDMITLADGEYELQRTVFRPMDVINKVIEKSINYDIGSRVNFEYHADPMTPTALLGDAQSLITVLDSVIDNAVNYTERGRITINASWSSEELNSGILTLEVKDTGCGMSEEILENIYLAFSVGQEIQHKHENGIGLGLYIAKKILDLMGGTIQVESHLHIGTTVTVNVPFDVIDPTPIATSQKKESLQDYELVCSNAKILIVEDDAINARSIKRQLEHFHAQVHICESGEETLEYLATGPTLDLILMDYLLPGINGIEVTNRIRNSGVAIHKVPIVAVSADAVEGRKQQFLEAKMNDVLFKPFEITNLMEILSRWLPPEKILLTKKPEKRAMHV